MARSRTRRVAFALAVMTPLLGACSAILGISDYEKAECPGGGACLDDGGSNADTGGNTDAADVRVDAPVNVVDAQGVDPVSWAQKPMPNYRQVDGGPTDNLADASPGTSDGFAVVTDNVTGFVWRKPVDANKVAWEAAKTSCPAGWRLPTRIELVTLLDLTVGQAVRAESVYGLARETYWTSSLQRSADAKNGAIVVQSRHWVVDFAGGTNLNPPVNLIAEDETAAVICVKAK